MTGKIGKVVYKMVLYNHLSLRMERGSMICLDIYSTQSLGDLYYCLHVQYWGS